MRLYKCYLTHNPCYQRNANIKPIGIMVHSTGCCNPWLLRYVQPDDGRLGVNRYGTDWNRDVGACVDAFIGRVDDGSIATYQTLPWTHRSWHCGGPGNDSYISFEICEDLNDEDYFRAVYQEAVELTAYLCRKFDLDPLADGVVICHAEGYRRDLASNHADVEHWFGLYGVTMDNFRAAVAGEITKEELERMEKEIIDRINKETFAMLGEIKNAEAESIRKIADAEAAAAKRIQAMQGKRYRTIDNLPAWAKPAVQYFIGRGIVKGRGTTKSGQILLDLTEIETRSLVYLYRVTIDARYKTPEDLPEWAQETVADLLDTGVIKGRGTADNGQPIVDLSDDMARILVMLGRK